MQCAYHSSSWTSPSVRAPVGWICRQGWLFQMPAGMSFLSSEYSLHVQSEPQNLLGQEASPALSLKHMHVCAACGLNQ